MIAEDMGSGNTIVAIIGAIAGAGWIGNVLAQYVKSNSEIKLKKLELEDEMDDLIATNERIKEEIEVLREARDDCEKRIKEEDTNRRALMQKLASIEVAFNITYLHLRTKFPPDDPILAELKKHIDNGTGNIT